MGIYISLKSNDSNLKKIYDISSKLFGDYALNLKDYHITIIYDARTKFRKIPINNSKIKLKFGYPQYWEGRDKAGYFVLPVLSKSMYDLHYSIKKDYNLHHDFPIYKPHLTIASGSREDRLGVEKFSDLLYNLVYSGVLKDFYTFNKIYIDKLKK